MKKITSAGPHYEVSLLLHNIRSIHNVGSIFRTADAFGVKRMYLSGYTPAPLDRFGRKRADLAKVALGAEDSVGWEVVETALPVFFKKIKKEQGATIIALEQNENSINYKEVASKLPNNRDKGPVEILLVLGEEVKGITPEILSFADIIAEIPMNGVKESLNVSVATGIALFGMF